MFLIKKKEKYIKTNTLFKNFKYLILISTKDISFIKKKYFSFFLLRNILKVKKYQIIKNIKKSSHLSNICVGLSYLYTSNDIFQYLKLILDFFYFQKGKTINLIYIIRENYIININIFLKYFYYYKNNIYFYNIFLFNLITNIYFLCLSKVIDKYLFLTGFKIY